ncbi:MAG: ATP-binding cassette domain-containing protein [Bacillota bacterium]|nr:ATP-binding cassette domain-containing protein [Bacillota bacterium]
MLEIKNLSKTFNKGTDMERQIFKDLDLSIEENSVLALIGTNGCGKSTLMNLIGGNILPDAGSISLDGKDLSQVKESKRSKYIGRVYQNPSMGVCPSLSILENMALADNKNKAYNLSPLIKKDKIGYYKDLLKSLDLGLENILDKKVYLLSGGQRQSLSLIMAAMKDPKVLLLDEHTAALDPKTSQLVMAKTKELIKEKSTTTIMITHKLEDALDYADRVVMLKEGKIYVDQKTKDLSLDDLASLYREKSL